MKISTVNIHVYIYIYMSKLINKKITEISRYEGAFKIYAYNIWLPIQEKKKKQKRFIKRKSNNFRKEQKRMENNSCHCFILYYIL